MHDTQTTDVRGVCPPVCLSRGLTRLHCAKSAKRIKILFGVNTFGGPRTTVLDGGPDPPQGGAEKLGKFCQLRTHYISGLAQARDLKYCVSVETLEL